MTRHHELRREFGVAKLFDKLSGKRVALLLVGNVTDDFLISGKESDVKDFTK